MTLREHLQAIVDSFDYLESAAHAQAALDILDAAGVVSTPWFSLLEGEHRLVPDASPDPQDTNT